MEMTVGAAVKTTVEKKDIDGAKDILIPKGAIGTICELYEDWAFIQVWGDETSNGIEGVYPYALNEFVLLNDSSNN